MRKCSIALGSLALAGFLVEGAFRWLEPRLGVDRERIAALRVFTVQGSGRYSPYPYTNYIAQGLAGSDVHPVDWAFDLRPHAEAPRVACLGGSTTYGSYPSFLRERLERKLAAPVEVMNWGVPGWNTLDTMVNYFIDVQDYEPDIVILHHAINDVMARTFAGYRTDLAHWRTPWTAPRLNAPERWLVRASDLYAWFVLEQEHVQDLQMFTTRRGPYAPDPLNDGSQRGFERNLRTVAEHARLRGAHVVLTTQPFDRTELDERWVALTDQHNRIVRELAAREGYVLVDVARAFAPYQDPAPGSAPPAPEDAGVPAPKRPGRDVFLDHVHLYPAWERYKAELIAAAILRNGWLDEWGTPEAAARLREGRGRARAARAGDDPPDRASGAPR